MTLKTIADMYLVISNAYISRPKYNVKSNIINYRKFLKLR